MTHFTPGHRITLLRNGTEYFPALEHAIDASSREIFIETYIFEPDSIGLRIASALERAAARGVKVCLLLDGFGCKDFPKSLMQKLQDAKVEVLVFRPKISPWTLKRNRLRRLHRKLVVIDGLIGFIGGINIIDDMNTPGHTPPRVDYAVRIEGPLLRQMQSTVRRMWRRVAWTSLKHVFLGKLRRQAMPAGETWACFVKRDNAWNRRAIEQAYLLAIARAHNEIIIANAYFLPGIRFRHALMAAAQRGVRVVLLLQARVEYIMLDYASRALYGQFLSAGIEIYEYHASFMHSKVAVIDGHWATVGSSNIDPFSLLLSHEANIIVQDAGFSNELRQDILHSIDIGAHRVFQENWQHAPLIRRFFAWLTYGTVRFILGVIGYPDKPR